MDRTRQYGVLSALLAVFAGLGYAGFVATGGAVPYGKRFATSIQRGVESGGGSLVDLGRGVILAGPIQSSVVEFVSVLGVLTAAGVVLYRYADRLAERGR
ncbi:cobalamin transport operon protein [Halococcoides cellulosivorans]|uniref:Cobalamin transport operon protein n=1 Tax=Halococcoides cellulosivorans TaxID=1679096 RepID=A0A2R4WXN4_9EURY|nr:cobalamin transport operon protein [Halococcoides cellulosivorans]AWB26280.1 cobalamin transport operon protein [Halococcoides cellulosivorans]